MNNDIFAGCSKFEKNSVMRLLKEHASEINNNIYNPLYKDAYKLDAPPRTSEDKYCTTIITNLLFKVGINPLYYMEEVPIYFLCDRTGLKSIEIPGNVRTIEMDAFSGNPELEKVNIGEGVETIKDAFTKCWNLREVKFPSTIKHIDSMAFYRCDRLEKVYFNMKENQFKKLFPRIKLGFDNGVTFQYNGGSISR